VALELRRLCDGALAGMFDGHHHRSRLHRTPVVVDLSAVYHSPALPVVMTCVAAWLQAVLATDDGVRRMVVMDESWRMFSCRHRLLDAAVVHAVQGFGNDECPGDLPSLQPRRHRDPHIYGRSASEVEQARELLGLSDTEAGLLRQLPRGHARWKVETRSFLVEHRLSACEWLS
jgi:hypothetical protein